MTNAWVTVIWTNEQDHTYPRLVMALINSLLSVKTKHDICILADPFCFQSLMGQKQWLQHIHGKRVQILAFDRTDMIILSRYNWSPTFKQREYYTNEFNQAICSKALAFALTQYDKIAVIDADCIVQINCDDLFDITSTPAATFSNYYSKEPDVYGHLEHNESIDNNVIRQQLKAFRGFVGSGTLYLIEPTLHLFDEFKNWIMKFQEYGYSKNLNGIEEQAFAEFFIDKNNTWYCISHCFISV
ncbi:MAG: hypothetical protein EOP45_08760 [Sphingobacteriaceae bacterium]|nr:MAG: hypothetical protein EOP45_08760 [Sphingobacteriaceae bacterium]